MRVTIRCACTSQIAEQQAFESNKRSEALQTRINIMNTEQAALQTGFDKAMAEIARATQRIALSECCAGGAC